MVDASSVQPTSDSHTYKNPNHTNHTNVNTSDIRTADQSSWVLPPDAVSADVVPVGSDVAFGRCEIEARA